MLFPATVGVMAEWWRARNGVLTGVSDDVSAWGGYYAGTALEQSTEAQRPTYLEPSANLNGKNTVSFDGNDRMEATLSVGLSYTMIAIARVPANGNGLYAFTNGGATNTGSATFSEGGSEKARRVGSGANDATTPISYPYEGFFAATFEVDRATVRVDQTDAANENDVAGFEFDDLIVGAISDTGVYGLAGELAELLFYKGQLPSADIDAVYDFFAPDYGY